MKEIKWYRASDNLIDHAVEDKLCEAYDEVFGPADAPATWGYVSTWDGQEEIDLTGEEENWWIGMSLYVFSEIGEVKEKAQAIAKKYLLPPPRDFVLCGLVESGIEMVGFIQPTNYVAPEHSVWDHYLYISPKDI